MRCPEVLGDARSRIVCIGTYIFKDLMSESISLLADFRDCKNSSKLTSGEQDIWRWVRCYT